MKRIIMVYAVLLYAIGLAAQVKLPQVRVLEGSGWKVQHSVMSWDSLSVYFSAQGPQDSSYELYVLRSEGYRWGQPERLSTICTDGDELWPSISSDESMLFFVLNGYICRAWLRGDQWEEPAPIIISNGHDTKPQILEDNRTLLFERQEEMKKGEGPWHTMTASIMDDHNWTVPQEYTERPAPEPVMVLNGSLVDAKNGKPVGDGRVMVYNAMNEQLQQAACVHAVNGRWRIALLAKKHYRIELTAKGYSYHYIDVRTDTLRTRTEKETGAVMIGNQLRLSLNTYDEETQEISSMQQKVLPLGQLHKIHLQQTGYHDTVLVVNTLRPTIFTETELDIPMRPKKSLHHFRVTNIRDNQAVEDAVIRLNGASAPADTALRIGHELALQVSAPGYLFYDTLIHTGNDTRERTIAIRLQPLEKDLVLQLRNIQFEYDSYELTEGSHDALEALAQLMFINPTLRIELSAHTDDLGSDKYNDRLSSLRGQAVAKWLKERGVEADRVESKGYGKRKPLVPNDSDENRALNRRVEIKVTAF